MNIIDNSRLISVNNCASRKGESVCISCKCKYWQTTFPCNVSISYMGKGRRRNSRKQSTSLLWGVMLQITHSHRILLHTHTWHCASGNCVLIILNERTNAPRLIPAGLLPTSLVKRNHSHTKIIWYRSYSVWKSRICCWKPNITVRKLFVTEAESLFILN